MRNVLVVLIALVIAMTPIFGAGQTERVPAQKTVTVFGAFVDEEAHRFEESIRPFEEKTGIKVIYEGSKDFETLISVRVEGGNAPDIAGLPQPGLMANFAEKGKLVPVWPSLSALLDKNYAPVWRELGSYEGTTYGIFHRVNAKSFVWYPKKAWEKAGYVPPTTWDELNRLMDRMVADGHTPWAVGIEAGGATGWVGTDWIEDIMLRTAGPDAYDRWVSGEMAFNAPEVKAAFEVLGKIWLDPKYVYGGKNYILTTSFGDAQQPLFTDPPRLDAPSGQLHHRVLPR